MKINIKYWKVVLKWMLYVKDVDTLLTSSIKVVFDNVPQHNNFAHLFMT